MGTVFQTYPKERSAFINPEDFTKRNPDFPELCVSTFSKGIIDKFAALDSAEVIGHLYTANGETPVYRIVYKHTPIAFYLSRVGAPACVAGIEEIIALGAKKNSAVRKLRDPGSVCRSQNHRSHIGGS